MAIINEDEDETRNINRSVSGGTSYIGGGGGGGGAAPQQAEKTSQTPGTGFRNISDYLSGPSGSARMAGGIAGETERLGKGAVGKIGEFEQSANTETAIPEFDSAAADNMLYGVSKAGTKPGQTATFKDIPGATYNGPTGYSSVSGYAPAQKAVSDVNQRVKDSGTWEGTQEQLRTGAIPGTNYTPGMARFDTLLTRGGPGSGVLEKSQKDWGGIGDWLGKSEQGVQSQIGKSKENAAKWQNVAEQGRTKAAETNKYYSDLATEKQKIAAGQGAPGEGNYTTGAQVPAPAAAPTAAPAAQQGGGSPMSKEQNLAYKWTVPDTDRLLTPTPAGLSSDELRRSEPGRLSKDAQGGMYYYMDKANQNINKWLGG